MNETIENILFTLFFICCLLGLLGISAVFAGLALKIAIKIFYIVTWLFELGFEAIK